MFFVEDRIEIWTLKYFRMMDWSFKLSEGIWRFNIRTSSAVIEKTIEIWVNCFFDSTSDAGNLLLMVGEVSIESFNNPLEVYSD